jgi:tRNA U34 5-carboxymethylaminomethyl modifying GTPase MnmE/TrmE
MPFNMNEAMHMFTPTNTGGVQEIMVHDGNAQQISLVHQHLQQQAIAFAHGDFSNPAYVHGKNMPGLSELEHDYSRMTVTYANTDLGGKIIYTSTDSNVVNAIHQWFQAQVHDHGSHAIMNCRM